MYFPKRSYDNVSDGTVEYKPTRALTARNQNLLDATVIIKELSLDEDLGYFVTKCAHGNPCANDVHGLHYLTNA